MNTSSGPFSWWLEERGHENKNFYGWNHSTKPSTSDHEDHQSSSTKSNEKSEESETWSLYDDYHAVDTMDEPSPPSPDDIQSGIFNSNFKPKSNSHRNTRGHPNKSRNNSMKQIHRELDCIFMNEVPTSMHYDGEHHQLFVGTLMGNIHRFRIIHNEKIEATGILPNPNVYHNVSNVHSFTRSIYDYDYDAVSALHTNQSTESQDDAICSIPSESTKLSTNQSNQSNASNASNSSNQSNGSRMSNDSNQSNDPNVSNKSNHHSQSRSALTENQQRIHQRLYEQREIMKVKERQNHHKKCRRKMALIPDNDSIYNKAVISMVSYNGNLYIADAASNIHAFDIEEWRHLKYIDLNHYFVEILHCEYRVHVDLYYQKRLKQYQAQHDRMMFKSNEPKDIHSVDPFEEVISGNNSAKRSLDNSYSFYNNNIENVHLEEEENRHDDNEEDDEPLFSSSFLRSRNGRDGGDDRIDVSSPLSQGRDHDITDVFGIEGGTIDKYSTPKDGKDILQDSATMAVKMRIGGGSGSIGKTRNREDSAYEMYFDELVFATTMSRQKEHIMKVTDKLRRDVMITDLVTFQDSLFIPTNLPHLSVKRSFAILSV